MSDLAILPAPEFMAADCLRAASEIAALVGTRVATNTVADGPCIRVTRLPLGSSSWPLWLDRAVLQVEGWAGTLVTNDSPELANRIAQTARAVLNRDFRGTQPDGVVARLDFSGLGSSPDTSQPTRSGPGRSRYLFTVAVVVRPRALTGS